MSEPADRETMAAELQRTNPAELLYAEDFAEMSLIEGRRGLRRRPLWEFEIDTARQQLNLQFGTRDLVASRTRRADFVLPVVCCSTKDTQRTTLPHIVPSPWNVSRTASLWMPRHVVTWKLLRTWRAVRKIRWLLS
ncbi:hypothetical protein ACLK1X_15295 [Escherichia coli]